MKAIIRNISPQTSSHPEVSKESREYPDNVRFGVPDNNIVVSNKSEELPQLLQFLSQDNNDRDHSGKRKE